MKSRIVVARMSPNSLTLSLLAVTSLVHITHAFLNPLMDRRTSNANILVPRQRGGGGSDIYYESCQETYGAGYAECYDSCYNAAAGKTCCEGNCTSSFILSAFQKTGARVHADHSGHPDVCFNGEYCGYGLYAYCCYDVRCLLPTNPPPTLVPAPLISYAP